MLPDDKVLIFASSTELIRVPSQTVVYITADGNYSVMTLADGEKFILTLQLGQIEKGIADQLESNDHRFIRIGRSLIVNRDFIAYINPTRQKLTLSDCRTFRHHITASREALKALKELTENETEL